MKIPVASIINQIRQNLGDRYKSGFPILRELIQNADDAYASCLDIALTIGISSAKHPLLRGPALIVTNDGEFNEKNARAINCIGLSSKFNNQFAVGRYGLGLKSVFHLCEAFFFFSSLDKSLHLVNPWAEDDGKQGEQDNKYPEWGIDDPNDRDAVYKLINPIITSYRRYFCLWIPLRKKSHFDKRHPIIHELPGEGHPDLLTLLQPTQPTDNFSLTLEIELSKLLPLLRSINMINGWTLSDQQIERKIVFNIGIDQQSERLKFPGEKITPNMDFFYKGRIRINSDRFKSITAPYAGIERLLENERCRQLQQSEYWPKHSNENPETGELIEQKDNAQPHISVLFGRFPVKKSGFIDIRRAVFLPLEKSTEIISFSNDENYGLILHGWYFVDAGRSDVHGWEKEKKSPLNSTEDIILNWNGNLAQQGMLLAVLPALEYFINQFQISSSDILNLTESIKNSKLFEEFGEFICKYYQWVYCYSGKESKWQRLPANQKILVIPDPPESDLDRPLKVLPALKGITYNITIPSYPQLNNPINANNWDQEILLSLLESIPVEEVFSKKGYLTYLRDFLSKEFTEDSFQPISQYPNIERTIFKLSQKAIAQVGFEKLSVNKGLFQEFYSKLPVERIKTIRMSVENARMEYFSFLDRISYLSLNILVLPADSEIRSTIESHSIPIDDAEKILLELASLKFPSGGNVNTDDVRTNIAFQIIQSVADKSVLLTRIKTLKLFKGRKFSDETIEEVLFSFDELKLYNSDNLLFRYANDGSEGMARELRRALSTNDIVIIKKEISDGFDLNINDCNLNGCIKALQQKPKLKEVLYRKILLEKLLTSTNLAYDNNRKVIRYLLHGNQENFDDSKNLFAGAASGDVWSRLSAPALDLMEEQWRVVVPELANIININQRKELNVIELNRDNVVSFLNKLNPHQRIKLNYSGLSDQDRREVILTIAENNRDILRDLSLHKSITGNYVNITPTTFLYSSFHLDPILLAKATLLYNPGDSLMEAAYEKIGVKSLDASAAIHLALNQPNPVNHWRVIMDALDSIKIFDELDPSVSNLLKKEVWLPIISSLVPKAPSNILHIPNLEKNISEILLKFDTQYISVLELDNELKKHSAYKKLLQRIIPYSKDVLDNISSLVVKDETYRIGIKREGLNENLLDTFLSVFCSDEGSQLMPSARLIMAVKDTMKQPDALDFARKLCSPLPINRYISVLNYLSKQHESALIEQKVNLLILYNQYLIAVCDIENFQQEILPYIRLLNKRNQWKDTNVLCYKTLGIDAEFLINEHQGQILKLDKKQPDTLTSGVIYEKQEITKEGFEKSSAICAKLLDEYFSVWEPYIQNRELIGGFLCLLGNAPEICEKAKKYLGNRDITQTRNMLKWDTGVANWPRGKSVDERMNKEFIYLKIITNEEHNNVRLNSITGDEFVGSLTSEGELEHLLFDNKVHTYNIPVTGEHYDYLCLRRIKENQFTQNKLIDLLKETAKKILFVFYFQDIGNFDDFWTDLEHSEQLDIEIAQDYIIDETFSYLRTLGLTTDPLFRNMIKKWDEIHKREVQAFHNQDKWDRQVTEDFDKLRRDLKKELKNVFENDPGEESETKAALLNAVRRKIGQDYQYKTRSILFELFQNADDAVTELGGLIAESQIRQSSDICLDQEHRRVVVAWNHSEISFLHWGRAINQIHPGSGNEYGYDADLIKMLLMQQSDKLIAPDLQIGRLTGKFGLGFKSVFLISRNPKVVSGRLKFEIQGGLYPSRLDNEDYNKLSNILEEFSQNTDHKGSIFELPIDPESLSVTSTDEIINEFFELSHILVIFSRQIKKIEFHKNGERSIDIAWSPQKIKDDCLWEIGDIKPFSINPDNINGRAIVWRSPERQILLLLGPQGFIPLEKNIPKIWVTTPTEEKPNIGIIFNGDFHLDVGRAQLARSSSHNRELAEKLGNDFGKGLIDLYNLSVTDGQRFFERLGLPNDQYAFWKSFWQVVAEPFIENEGNEVIDLLKHLLGKKDCGLSALWERTETVPSGLFDDYEVLTRLDRVKYFLSGCLEDNKVFSQISQWPAFQGFARPGCIVSSNVHKVLSNLIENTPDMTKVSLAQVIKWVIGPKEQVTPDNGTMLGCVITSQFISDLNRDEKEPLMQYLNNLLFLCCDGINYPIKEILTNNADPTKENEVDEKRRTFFAPQSNILSNEYQDEAVFFFRACREKLNAPVEKMKEWCFSADNEDTRKAVLDYILNGELGRQLAESLRNSPDFMLSWFANLVIEDQLLASYDIDERSVILGSLCLTGGSQPVLSYLPDACEILEKVYDWWNKYPQDELQKYEQDIYPNGSPAQLCTESHDLINFDHRKEWMILFLLGSSHTYGWTTHGATYRNFLQDCQTKGWFNTFLNSQAESDEWMKVLEDYMDLVSTQSDVNYQFLFSRQFVNIYQISRYLEHYVPLFLTINRINERFSIDQITNPNESEIFARSGVHEVPHLRKVLGGGVCFVIRELVRRGVLDSSELVFEHCFTSVKSIRNLFWEMNCILDDSLTPTNSIKIYEFLVNNLGKERANFDGAFDIPFLIIADKYTSMQNFWDQEGN